MNNLLLNLSLSDIFMPLFGLGVVVFFLWLFAPTSQNGSLGTKRSVEPFIDPNDSHQLGLLAGLAGGTVPDAAAMRFALRRFEEKHGRRATSRDIGLVLGLIRSA